MIRSVAGLPHLCLAMAGVFPPRPQLGLLLGIAILFLRDIVEILPCLCTRHRRYPEAGNGVVGSRFQVKLLVDEHKDSGVELLIIWVSGMGSLRSSNVVVHIIYFVAHPTRVIRS